MDIASQAQSRSGTGDLTKVVQNALDIWTSFDKMQVKTTPKELINYSFVK